MESIAYLDDDDVVIDEALKIPFDLQGQTCRPRTLALAFARCLGIEDRIRTDFGVDPIVVHFLLAPLEQIALALDTRRIDVADRTKRITQRWLAVDTYVLGHSLATLRWTGQHLHGGDICDVWRQIRLVARPTIAHETERLLRTWARDPRRLVEPIN